MVTANRSKSSIVNSFTGHTSCSASFTFYLFAGLLVSLLRSPVRRDLCDLCAGFERCRCSLTDRTFNLVWCSLASVIKSVTTIVPNTVEITRADRTPMYFESWLSTLETCLLTCSAAESSVDKETMEFIRQIRLCITEQTVFFKFLVDRHECGGAVDDFQLETGCFTVLRVTV